GAYFGTPPPGGVEEQLARLQEAALDEPAEGDARLLAARARLEPVGVAARRDGGDALAREARIGRVLLDADVAAAEAAGDDTRGAGAEEGIEDHPARLGCRHDAAMEERFGLLGRVRLAAGAVLETLRTGAERDEPVAAHLQLVVQRLHGLVIEGVARGRALGAPDERLVRVGEAPSAEVRHRVGLAPDHVVQDPEAEVLEDGAHAKDVVVAADHPERAVLLERAARRREPSAREGVVSVEVVELVPRGLAAVDARVVGSMQLARELQIV